MGRVGDRLKGASGGWEILNPKQITGFVLSNPAVNLTAKQIAFRLEDKCRGVDSTLRD